MSARKLPDNQGRPVNVTHGARCAMVKWGRQKTKRGIFMYCYKFLQRNRISNEEVRRRTDQPPLTGTIRTTRLKYFGHIARADPSMDHSRALRASVAPLPRDLKPRAGRSRHTWLRTVDSDHLAPLNIGLATAYHRVQNRHAWSKLVGTATSASGQAT